MIMFFSEEDMRSFGTYMVSSLRKKAILKSRKDGETDEEIKNRIESVSDADFGNWNYLLQETEKEFKGQSETKKDPEVKRDSE